MSALFIGAVNGRPARAADLSSEAVLKSIERAKKLLVDRQNADGSWSGRGEDRFQVGVSSLALLALLNGGMTVKDEPVQKALQHLRKQEPEYVYEMSLLIMALAAAKDGQRDKPQIQILATRLESAQITNGENAGSWSYKVSNQVFQGDRSNGQFAVLGLREAALAGADVSRTVWERARRHWLASQNADGGWGYSGVHNQTSTGSMTVAGIATLVITAAMLRDDKDVNPDGTPQCCPDQQIDEQLERGLRWLENHFAVGHNPGSQNWGMYYLYGLERAGRLSGRRFFGDHDWYREGAKFLVDRQSARWGSWQGSGGLDSDEVVGTSFGLLFLSKGLAPVLMNKLQFPSQNAAQAAASQDWNNHRDDVRNITELITGLEKWPKLLNWQMIDIAKVQQHGGVQDLLQSPILYISGRDAPQFSDEQIKLLREFIDQGGFIFAVRNCQGAGFEEGVNEIVARMFPAGEAQLKPLPADHPVYRSEYLLDPDSVELLGVDFGCRTAIIYSPADLSCLWDKWAQQDPRNRHDNLKAMIIKATRVGVNVVAYATGREPPDKLEREALVAQDGQQDKIERGFLQIAKLRHTGTWDAAPQALRNLLLALNRTVGMAASTKRHDLLPTDSDIYKYPILYMHGRTRFQLSSQERQQMKEYLERGGVLFADACCGASQFDQSFRSLMEQTFPGKKLQRIPPDHEMFTTRIGHDIRRVKRRVPEAENPKAALNTLIQEGEPFLEGIEIEGRWAVIYSKYDISCALERQASLTCAGYVPDDALRIAVNVVLYALMQDVRYYSEMK
jgi:hypothetical protein